MAQLLPDLDIRTVLNVVEENFERLGLKAYAIRMIYIGEHVLRKEELINHFKASISDVNAGYCEIHVYGLLLVYDSYFVHVVEGSEDTVHRHLRFLFNREAKWVESKIKEKCSPTEETGGLTDILEEPDTNQELLMFKRLKMLIVYHSIQTRMFDKWSAVTARPPSLVGKLDVHGPRADHVEQLRICLDKIRRTCLLINAESNMSFEGLRAVDPRMEALPEVALLDYLLNSQYILDLRHVVHLHRRVDDYTFYFESVWPLPTHFTPRLLYKLKIDDSFVEPLPVMPWELKKETVEEEEREEQQSNSSTSD